jgi:hypothetical protein
MLTIFTNNDKKTTTAVINDFETDALQRIGRTILGRHPECVITDEPWDKREIHVRLALNSLPNGNKAIMSNKIVGTVKCDEEDEYKADVGEGEAVKKAMKNHNKAFKKALVRWQAAMLQDIMAVSPETFEQALHSVRPCKCKCD